jgi:hypothetical protein
MRGESKDSAKDENINIDHLSTNECYMLGMACACMKKLCKRIRK